MRSRYLFALLVGVAAISLSCVHRATVAKATVPTQAPLNKQMGKSLSKPESKPVSNWDRQVRNAVDAGDGDYQLRVLREKVAAEPGNIPVRLELAQAYRDRGYHEVALEISRLAVARFPQSGEAQLALVRDLREVNRRSEAIASLEGFLKAHPDSSAAHYSWLGILRDESGVWPLGEPAHRKAIELTPAVDYLHNNLGYNLLMQTKNAEAAEEFEKALKLNPGSRMARNNLGIAQAQLNATTEAVANWQSTSDPATAHNNLAAVWMEKGNYPDARRELNLALGYNRAHPAALRNMELVGRLDGKQGALSQDPLGNEGTLDTRWQRFRVGLRRLFVGPLTDSRKDAPQSASAH